MPAEYPTIADLASRQLSDGSIDGKISEAIIQTNEVMMDLPMIECNDGDGHKTSAYTGIPASTWRRVYGGAQPSKATTVQVRDTTGQAVQLSQVDYDLARRNGNTESFRWSEDRAHIAGLGQDVAQAVFKADEGDNAELFTGLEPRFNDIGSAAPATKNNIIDAGGTGTDNRSIWLCVWGENTVHGIYPKGTPMGLVHEDHGLVMRPAPNQYTLQYGAEQAATSSTNTDAFQPALYKCYESWFEWNIGLSVRRWDSIVRICNLDISDLEAGNMKWANGQYYKSASAVTGTPDIPNIPNLIFKAETRVRRVANLGKMCLYAGRDVIEALQIQLSLATQSSSLTVEQVGGQRVYMFQGIPLRIVDALMDNETRVT